MRRHDEESGQLSSAPRRQRREFARCFLTRIADARNLNAAVEHLCRDGDKSPGPNGICLRSLDDRERWQLCRALGQAILDGSYRPGPTRTVRIPKSSGSGTRQLTLHNAEDVVVHRAVVQILQPFLDPQFSEKSFGFRPGLGPEDALLAAAKIAEGQERWSWVTEDIADAFGSVPHVRLLESLHAHDLGEDVIALIARIIGTRSKSRGLAQGSPLSPLLLNSYLDRVLDRKWPQVTPDVHLVRYADDIALFAQIEQSAEARQAQQELQRLLIPAGFTLKEGSERSIRNLTTSSTIWLGYELRRRNGALAANIAPRAWRQLEAHLKLAQVKPLAPLRATETVHGWLDQRAPCLENERRRDVYKKICEAMRVAGFLEYPSKNELRNTWKRAEERWNKKRDKEYYATTPRSIPASSLIPSARNATMA